MIPKIHCDLHFQTVRDVILLHGIPRAPIQANSTARDINRLTTVGAPTAKRLGMS